MKDFFQKLNFTPTERKVVISLVGAFLVGLAIQFFRSVGGVPGPFDYSAADSEFTARSAVVSPEASIASGDTPAATARPGDSPDGPGIRRPVNLNTADSSELRTLPGVGAAIAARIVRYRTDHGAFRSVRDLLKVSGIGEKKLERVAHLCVVE